MRNLKYETVVYNNGIYGIKSGIRKRIHDKTRECLRRKRSFNPNRKISTTELIIKLSLIISILSLVTVIWLG